MGFYGHNRHTCNYMLDRMATTSNVYSTQCAPLLARHGTHSEPPSKFANREGVDAFEKLATTFQILLSEEAVPVATRFWLARLQAPLFRIALNDGTYANDQTHPARGLLNTLFILALDAGNDSEKEASTRGEIKRAVQLIEQFPDYGMRTYALLLAELSAKAETVAHQTLANFPNLDLVELLEQRDELIIRFTIELRESIKALKMNWCFRHFFLCIWSKILASSALRGGVNHMQIRRFREVETDLLALSQLSPSDRGKAAPKRSKTLRGLEEGMTLISMQESEKETYLQMFIGTSPPH